MAPEMIKNNLMLPWALTAKGFQGIKSPTKFPDGPQKTRPSRKGPDRVSRESSLNTSRVYAPEPEPAKTPMNGAISRKLTNPSSLISASA